MLQSLHSEISTRTLIRLQKYFQIPSDLQFLRLQPSPHFTGPRTLARTNTTQEMYV